MELCAFHTHYAWQYVLYIELITPVLGTHSMVIVKLQNVFSRPLFNTVDSKCSIKFFANDWIRIEDLWNWKQLLFQLSHHHCPKLQNFIIIKSKKCNYSKFPTAWKHHVANILCKMHKECNSINCTLLSLVLPLPRRQSF